MTNPLNIGRHSLNLAITPSPPSSTAKKNVDAHSIAKDYGGENISGKNEKENIDRSLAFFDEYTSQSGSQIGNANVQKYIKNLLDNAAKNVGIDLPLLKAFVAVHDAAKLKSNLHQIGHEVTPENQNELYQKHDILTGDVMTKVYGFSQRDVSLFNHHDVRSVVDCFDVLGNSPFLKNIESDGQPLLKTLLDAKSKFDEGLNKMKDNIGGIASVVNTSPRNLHETAEEVFKKQFCIAPGSRYDAFKETLKKTSKSGEIRLSHELNG